MPKLDHQTYSFDEFTLDVTRESLIRGSEEIKLRPKSFGVLKYLVENGGRLVTKEELFEAVWKDAFVTDDSLVKCIKDVRLALGDDDQQLIKTLPRRGYVFAREVTENGSAGQVYSEVTTGVQLVIEETEDSTPRSSRVGRMFAALRRHKLATALTLTGVVLAAGGAAYGLFLYFLRPPVSPFKSVTIIKNLTTDGKVEAAAISPDGKYVAYALDDGGKQSLWVRQVAVLNSVQLVAPAAVEYTGLTFSPDGNFVYYVQGRVLYQTGTFGGATRKLWEGVDTKVTFSADGQRLAFLRLGAGDGLGSRLVLANADGTGEPQILAYRKRPEAFAYGGCAWSPDGATIVCAGGDNAFFGQQLPIAVRVADGRQTPLTAKTWNQVSQPAWLADGSGFIMSAFDNMNADSQLWHVTFPGGVPVRIYNDLNGYLDVSITADSETLVTIQQQAQLNLHALDLNKEPHEDKQLTFRSVGGEGRAGIATAPDGRIVYSSEAGGYADLWIMDPNGGNQRQLTFDEALESSPVVSPDSRSVAFGVASKGIWKVDLDGGNLRQLTRPGMFPCFSPDGKWVFYNIPREKFSLWKVPVEGGEPVRVTDHPAVQPAVSPDGKLIAYVFFKTFAEAKLYIAPIEGGEPLKVIDVLPLRVIDLEWTRDSLAVVYGASENGVLEVVSQPIDGSARKVLIAARSASESFRAFTFSPDGKQLYYSAGPINQNVVMFSLKR